MKSSESRNFCKFWNFARKFQYFGNCWAELHELSGRGKCKAFDFVSKASAEEHACNSEKKEYVVAIRSDMQRMKQHVRKCNIIIICTKCSIIRAKMK